MTCGWTRSRKATVLLALAASIAMALGMDGPAGLSTRDSDGTAGSPTATRPATQPVDDVWVNPFLAEGQWYKANLHSHTSVSDGPATPAERAEQYRRARYSILALTDHSHTQNDLGRLGDANFLVLNGVELSATGGYHLVAIGTPEGFLIPKGTTEANARIALVRAAGGIVVLGHPTRSHLGYYDKIRPIRGIAAIEVWNGGTRNEDAASGERQWGDALDDGWRLPAVASDDCHGKGVSCRAWTWLKMKSLTAEEAIRAIRTGACYATRGPQIEDFRLDGNQVILRCSPAAKIEILDPAGRSHTTVAPKGETVRAVSTRVASLSGWPWTYVRAVVTDSNGRKAWTPPIHAKHP